MNLSDFSRLIGLEIKRRRIELGLNQKEAGKRIRVTSQRWGQMENSQPPDQISTIFKICEALQCTMEDFLSSILNHKIMHDEIQKRTEEILKTLFKKGVIVKIDVKT